MLTQLWNASPFLIILACVSLVIVQSIRTKNVKMDTKVLQAMSKRCAESDTCLVPLEVIVRNAQLPENKVLAALNRMIKQGHIEVSRAA